MNTSKLVLFFSCFVAVTLAVPLVEAKPRGGGGGGGGRGGSMGMRGTPSFSRGGLGPAGARNWSGRNVSGRNWSGRNWSGRNWSGKWNGHNWRHSNGKWSWWNGNKWCHPKTNVVFIGDFGFPWWWGWGWGPWAGWGYGYPYYGYGYYGYGDPYGYDYGYGDPNGSGNGYGDQYSSTTKSRVAELQRRLARAGYYRGAIDGILGPQTRRAIRAYEQDHGYVG
jgi:Putative peptidoglycan binding domain